MSDLYQAAIACPQCQTTQTASLFRSLNADLIASQVEAIVDGSFERKSCAGCQGSFRPEHSMLYAHYTAGLWIVMHPRADRHRFVALEREVVDVIEDERAWAPPTVAEGLTGLRPRVVFGQHMLTEALRIARAGLDAALLECAKLLAVPRHLGRLLAHGPFELCFERRLPDDGVLCAVHRMSSGERVDELVLDAASLAEVITQRASLEQRWPELFQRPYLSATRYLYGTERL